MTCLYRKRISRLINGNCVKTCRYVKASAFRPRCVAMCVTANRCNCERSFICRPRFCEKLRQSNRWTYGEFRREPGLFPSRIEFTYVSRNTIEHKVNSMYWTTFIITVAIYSIHIQIKYLLNIYKQSYNFVIILQ